MGAELFLVADARDEEDGGGVAVDVAVEVEDVCLDTSVGASDGWSGADVEDGGSWGFSVEEDLAGVDAVGRDELALVGRDDVGCRETYLASDGVAVNDVTGEGVWSSEERGSRGDIATGESVAYLGGAYFDVAGEGEGAGAEGLNASLLGEGWVLVRRHVVGSEAVVVSHEKDLGLESDGEVGVKEFAGCEVGEFAREGDDDENVDADFGEEVVTFLGSREESDAVVSFREYYTRMGFESYDDGCKVTAFCLRHKLGEEVLVAEV